MAHERCKILDTGDIFPQMKFDLIGGGTMLIPGDFSGGWNVLLFYRGHW